MQGSFCLKPEINGGKNMSVKTEATSVSSKNKDEISKDIATPDISEFDYLMKESNEWATEVGMKPSDVEEAIKSVRIVSPHS